MASKIIICVGLAMMLSFEASNALDCYECSEDSIGSNPRVQQECLTQDDKFGESKNCNAFKGACAKSTWTENGKTFYYRTCEPNANTKIDTCEDRAITLRAGGTKNARTCYCEGNLCNGTSRINSGLYILGSLIFVILLVQKIHH